MYYIYKITNIIKKYIIHIYDLLTKELSNSGFSSEYINLFPFKKELLVEELLQCIRAVDIDLDL